MVLEITENEQGQNGLKTSPISRYQGKRARESYVGLQMLRAIADRRSPRQEQKKRDV